MWGLPPFVPGDLDGDGVVDRVVTDGPRVSVVSGRDGRVLIPAFAPFEASYTGELIAVYVDMGYDGRSELVVSPRDGGGPVVAVYNPDGTERGRFFGIDDPDFPGGVNLAAAEVGVVDPDFRNWVTVFGSLIVTAGVGGGPRVAVFDGSTLGMTPPKLTADFFAFEPGQRGRATAIDAGGTILFGAGPGGGPRVRGISYLDLVAAGAAGSLDGVPADKLLLDKFVGDTSRRDGVTLSTRRVAPPQQLHSGGDRRRRRRPGGGADVRLGTADVSGLRQVALAFCGNQLTRPL